MDVQHIPVLLEECLDYLVPAFEGRSDGLFVDCTVGLGGHSRALLERLPAARCLGIDRDPQALAASAQALADLGPRVSLVAGNFFDLEELLAAAGQARPVAVLADLGVSSLQLELAERGFSFRREGPLDMRMGGSLLTAAEILNGYPEAELERIFRDYGEERQARRIARAVVAERSQQPLATTTQLRQLIARAKGPGVDREGRVDPATRVFQALRIEVNQELAGLEGFLEQAVRQLEVRGRVVVISYHSLEDRIVKRTLRNLARGEVDPITGRSRSETQVIEVLTRKPVRPQEAEVARNPRSRSARLRAARRLP